MLTDPDKGMRELQTVALALRVIDGLLNVARFAAVTGVLAFLAGVVGASAAR